MDTVIIKTVKFKVSRPDLFFPEFKKRRMSELSHTERWTHRQYTRSFRLQPYAFSGYCPTLVIREGLPKQGKRLTYTMTVTVSLPKLIHGNSVLEVNPLDRDRICERLSARLSELGIQISPETIKTARVHAVHFCKNILLPTDIRAQEVLDELSRLDVNRTVDVTRKVYKNGGNLLIFFSGVRHYCFYEKISDALKTKNKREDKDVDSTELSFIERLGLKGKEVFRYEYRLTRQKVMDVEVNRVLLRDTDMPVMFSALFVPGLWNRMILRSWERLTQKEGNLLALKEFELGMELRLLSMILIASKKRASSPHSLNRALATYGLVRLVQEHGLRPVRSAIREVWPAHSERVTQRLRDAEELVSHLSCSGNIGFIAQHLELFTLVTLGDLMRGVQSKS